VCLTCASLATTAFSQANYNILHSVHDVSCFTHRVLIRVCLCISDESSADESSGCSELDDDEDTKVPWQSNEHKNATLYRLIEIRKQFLVSKIRPFQDSVGAGNRTQVLQTYIDYESAELISRYLASKRPFSQSFDRYLQQVSEVVQGGYFRVCCKSFSRSPYCLHHVISCTVRLIMCQ
jgi:hypothetical protein